MAYPEFRKQLDNVLRSKDPEAVRQFLVSQGQWTEETAIDAERAMWLMIAGSPTLQALHDEAQTWLIDHGYQSEAAMLRDQMTPPQQPGKAARRAQPGKTANKKRTPGSSTQQCQKHPKQPS